MDESTQTNKTYLEPPTSHINCYVCGANNKKSLNLRFYSTDEKEVCLHYTPEAHLQGYPDILHGGMIATLLDAAMTHALFRIGVEALTGDLHIRYFQSVPMGKRLTIKARVTRIYGLWYFMSSDIFLENEAMVSATAKFKKIRSISEN